MSENYEYQLKSSQSDVVLVAGGKELCVRKSILSARSPVFAAMFAHSTKEAQENRVEIIDADFEVLQLMVRYIYTDQVDMLKKYAAELFVAADKYQMDDLKSICEEALLSHISIKSVPDLLIFSDTYPAVDLFNDCLDYITNNGTRVMASKGWAKIATRADLLAKLYQRLQVKYSELQIVDADTRKCDSKKKLVAKIDLSAKIDDRLNLHLCPITIKTVSNLLILADMHKVTELVTKCVDFINDNATQVMAMDGWKKIAARADLLVLLFERLNLKYNRVFN